MAIYNDHIHRAGRRAALNLGEWVGPACTVAPIVGEVTAHAHSTTA